MSSVANLATLHSTIITSLIPNIKMIMFHKTKNEQLARSTTMVNGSTTTIRHIGKFSSLSPKIPLGLCFACS